MVYLDNSEFNEIIQNDVLGGIDRAFHALVIDGSFSEKSVDLIVEDLKENLPKYIETQADVILKEKYFRN